MNIEASKCLHFDSEGLGAGLERLHVFPNSGASPPQTRDLMVIPRSTAKSQNHLWKCLCKQCDKHATKEHIRFCFKKVYFYLKKGC